MNNAKLKRMTRKTEFYMFIGLILLCVVLQRHFVESIERTGLVG